MFRPVIPASGFSGWNFLQSTYDRQLASHSNSTSIENDRNNMLEKLSNPIDIETLLDDRRLLGSVLSSFNLEGEEWKRGFIDKVLTEASDPDSTFLARLNNPAYTKFAEAFKPTNGMISLSADQLVNLSQNFNRETFETAVGDVDNSMRLALNFQSDISELIGENSSNEANLYRLLGSVPVRTVLETATGLPTDIRSLTLEKQAELLQDRLSSQFGVNDLQDLRQPEFIDKVVLRFQAIESINQGPSASTPGSTALTLLQGIGSNASRNLFLSGLL
jgi:hypothetical protein